MRYAILNQIDKIRRSFGCQDYNDFKNRSTSNGFCIRIAVPDSNEHLGKPYLPFATLEELSSPV